MRKSYQDIYFPKNYLGEVRTQTTLQKILKQEQA